LSDDADHANDTDDCPTPLVDNPAGTDGAVVSGHAAVAAFTDATADTFPAASTAATPNTYDVPHDNPENTKLVPDTDPTNTPSRNTRYPATPTSSDDATHDNDTDDCPTPPADNPAGTDGAVVSGQTAVLAVIVVCAERLPAASTASTASV
jgi:hypothetical protein